MVILVLCSNASCTRGSRGRRGKFIRSGNNLLQGSITLVTVACVVVAKLSLVHGVKTVVLEII